MQGKDDLLKKEVRHTIFKAFKITITEIRCTKRTQKVGKSISSKEEYYSDDEEKS